MGGLCGGLESISRYSVEVAHDLRSFECEVLASSRDFSRSQAHPVYDRLRRRDHRKDVEVVQKRSQQEGNHAGVKRVANEAVAHVFVSLRVEAGEFLTAMSPAGAVGPGT